MPSSDPFLPLPLSPTTHTTDRAKEAGSEVGGLVHNYW